jgi:hypothetical protein
MLLIMFNCSSGMPRTPFFGDDLDDGLDDDLLDMSYCNNISVNDTIDA